MEVQSAAVQKRKRAASVEDVAELTRMKNASTFTSISGNAKAHIGDHHQHFHGPVNLYPGSAPEAQNQSNSTGSQNNSVQRLMALLKFTEMDVRYETVKLAHRDTCKWLPEHPSYEDWRDPDLAIKHGNFFWIKGKPGAGKSTLMKSAVKHAIKQHQAETTIFFFFNARGAAIEKSIEGMYRSILHQLLDAYPQLQKVLWSTRVTHQWHIPILQELFEEAILQLEEASLTCYLDALDECNEDDVREMIAFFEGVGQSTRNCSICFRVCFSSRHYPRITMGQSVELTLDDLEEHDEDIAAYIRNTLRISHASIREEFADLIRERARGVFLWVILVVKMLNKESDRGNAHTMRKRLDDIPDGVHQMFEESIVDRGADDTGYLLPILLWVLFAKAPLKLIELYHAVRYWREPRLIMTETNAQAMQDFILNASKGLIELTKAKEPTVQFVHLTVRDYLLSDGLGRLDSSLIPNPVGLCHDRLRQQCEAYVIQAAHVAQALSPGNALRGDLQSHDLEDTLIRRRVKSLAPFAEVASINLVARAEDAERLQVSQRKFVENFPLQEVRCLSKICPKDLHELYQAEAYTDSATKTYIFACEHAPNLLRLELTRLDDSTLAGERPGQTRDSTDAHGSDGINDTDASSGIFHHALQAAVYLAADECVELLLAHGVDVNASGGDYGNALQAACIRDNYSEYMVQLLLENGASVDAKGGMYGTALQAACSLPYEPSVRLLLQHGASVNITGGEYGTALQAACASGNGDIVQLLLQNGASVHVEGGCYSTALQAACARGDGDVVQLLLQNGASVHVEGGWYGTALQAACHTSNSDSEAKVRLLLQNGALVNVEGGEHGSALLAAVKPGKEDVVRLLLQHDADANIGCGEFGGPLQSATRWCLTEVAELLIAHGARVPHGYKLPSKERDWSQPIYTEWETFVDGLDWT